MNTTITTHLVAWATTSAAGSWDSHGIAILPQERETDENGHAVYRGETGIPVAEVDGDAATDGTADEDALDAMLAGVGYRRTDDWDDTTGDQLCADVEAIG